MAKKEEQVKVPEIIDNVDALIAKMDAMREAQREFATFTQEQVDKIFYEAASAANKMRLPLAKMAVEETGMGVVEDKVIKTTTQLSTSTMPIKKQRPAVLLKRIRHMELRSWQSRSVS